MIYATFTEKTLKEFLIGKVIKDIKIDDCTIMTQKWIMITFADERTLDLRVTLESLYGETKDAQPTENVLPAE